MWAALGQVLPIAVAAALSSVPILVTISILLSPNRRRSGPAFLIGWVVGIALAVVVFTALAYVIPAVPPRKSQVAIGVSLIVVGLALIVFAIVVWRRAAKPDPAGVPKWLSAAGSLGAWQAFGLALALNFRPKGLLLSAAAGLSLRAQDLTLGQFTVVVLIFTAISASTVAVPVIANMTRPATTERWLIDAREWVTQNNRIVSVLIMLLIGAVVVGSGLAHL
ncbi:GAP family protein [Cryobacterium adonitolivorans]|uniref:GAP family protein n=1 Tax=Cryobacterium adonitolivorans TaxID=1259189 RepID=A0A4R8WCB0_9MICO|nr:GAP family protein [Cryobacterium adonitolivorans]TFC06903.1 GAP family protein [Cryobacterium adonitolivorans]